MGIRTPIIREGDDIVRIVVDSVLEATAKDYDQMSYGGAAHQLGANLNYKGDVLGVTESVVARAAGLYVTVDEIAEDIRKKFGENPIIVLEKPIYSRNRFSMILKGIARAASTIYFIMPAYDEVGNPSGVNPFTGVDIQKYYGEICEKENCKAVFCSSEDALRARTGYSWPDLKWINCSLHNYEEKRKYNITTLADICADKNPDFGVLGSNKATEEKLKLFPTRELATKVCKDIQKEIFYRTSKYVYVGVFGDGCFKPLSGEIWECADPATMPGYSDPEIFESTPNEIKIKAFADDEFKDLSGKELDNAVKRRIAEKNGSLVGNMAAQGTTPRLFRDLWASTMDLITGSGDRGTPVALLQGTLDSYAD